MSGDFFLKHPRRDAARHLRWRIEDQSGTRSPYVRPSAHRLSPQLAWLGKGCLRAAVIVAVGGLLCACGIVYMLMLAR